MPPGPKKDPKLLAAIERQMVLGYTIEDHLNELPGLGFDTCKTTISRYRKVIYDRWKQEEVERRPERRAELWQMARFGFRDSIQCAQHMAASRFVDIMSKMAGVYEPIQIKVDLKAEIAAYTPAQRRAELKRLLEERARELESVDIPALPSAEVIDVQPLAKKSKKKKATKKKRAPRSKAQ